MSFIEAVMMEGCPHCADGVPKIVTFHHIEIPDHTHFVGEWEDEWKEACLRYGQLRIISCKAISADEDEQNDD
jgi:hypothetical protein